MEEMKGMTRHLFSLPILLLCLAMTVLTAGCTENPPETAAEESLISFDDQMPVVDGHNKLIAKYNFGPEAMRISDAVPIGVEANPAPPAGTIPASKRWVMLYTSKGRVKILVHRNWAPHAADHFIKLVEAEFYNGAPWYRVTESLAQCGIPGDPELGAALAGVVIPRDPMQGSNTAGTLSLVQRDPDSRSAQFFINRKDNLQLDGADGDNYYVPFAEVMQGMDVIAALHETGDPAVGFMERLARDGFSYFKKSFPDGDLIEKAVMMD
jgi:peptidyl-prolyl cis-trans isomerase A (cyclophilin A)